MTTTLITCEPTWMEALLQELKRTVPSLLARQLSPGWVSLSGPLPPDTCLVFAEQVLPDVTAIRQGSIQKLASAGLERLLYALDERPGPWRLHVFGIESVFSTVTHLRTQRLEEALLAKLMQQQPQRLASRTASASAPWQQDETLIQLGLESPGCAYFSVVYPEARAGLSRVLSRFPGGQVPVADDPGPPSTAFKKLVEAQLQLGRAIQKGDTCVDLGGSPGGWSYIALRQGASVTAVDRAPLRADLMGHARLHFQTGDAFKFTPSTCVDWLLCDVIAYPERSIALLEHWLEQKLCRAFIVTIKLKGREADGMLEPLKGMLLRQGVSFLVKHLGVNKNEVTAMGWRDV